MYDESESPNGGVYDRRCMMNRNRPRKDVLEIYDWSRPMWGRVEGI